MKLRKESLEALGIPITPMIDCVFLLLIFFMVGASLKKQEADISFTLPGTVRQEEPLVMPDEQFIEVLAGGAVLLNGLEYDSPASPDLPELTKTLQRLREACLANKAEACITIDAAGGAKHQRVVDVLNACSAARIDAVTFALEENL